MLEVKTNILIVGAGTGGAALIELFSKSAGINILGVVDVNPEAKGIKLAKELNISTSSDYKDFFNIKELDEIINVTGSEKIQEELLKLKPENVEVIGGHSAKLVWNLIEERLHSEEELKRNYETQGLINFLLRLSLENVTLDAFFEQALERLISVPWISFELRGMIFMIEEETGTLVIKAKSGINEKVIEKCSRIPLGKCICGQVALTGEAKFGDYTDKCHEVTYNGIAPHGNYCVPISSANMRLGVINLYVKEGLQPDKTEVNFLAVVANTLAGVIERKRAEAELKRNYETQRIIDSLLRQSLENIPLEEFLDRALKMLISIPWLSFESRGAIFLIEKDLNLLVMKSQSGLSASILKICDRVPLGKCHCGRAAFLKQLQFSNCLDDIHEISYEGITPHGHYCVPILSAGKCLGVINLYIKEGHQRSRRDEDFLIAVTNTLAGAIERKRAEDALKNSYIKLKEAQKELIQSEKLSALGRFSSGIAHEVKNPLGIMLGGVEYLERKLGKSEEDVKIAVTKIKEAILRADNVLLSLSKFSRPSELKIERINSADLVNEAVSFYKYRAPLSNINIKTEIVENDIYLEVDKNQIQQVIFNILLNSIDALPQGGDIAIKVYRKVLSEFSLGDQACVIEVADTGIGISKDNLSRIFEPFFTTKRDKKGTGLGLSIAKMIVENHKGSLQIESESGKGTTVRIILLQSGEREA